MLDLGVATPIDDYTDEVLTSAFKKVDVGKTSLKDILAIDDAWKNSSYLSAQLLIKEGYIKKGMTFHRDSKLMKAIYQAKNEAFKNNNFPKFTDDKWNPGDIWAVAPNFNVKSLNTATVRGLQKSILEHFVNRMCVGISLKKILKKAKSKELNVELPPDTDDYKVLKTGAKAIKSGRGDVWSSKGGTIQYDDGYLMIKDNSAYGSIKAEIEGKTARGGGVGWGYIKDSAKQTLRIVLPEIKTIKRSAQKIAKGDKKESEKMFKLMEKVEGTSRKDFDKNIKTKDGPWIHAKLGTLYMIEAVERFGGRKTNRWITKLINYAGSKTEDSSAYVKIYE
jgi:phage gpG-like protein